MLFRIWKWLDTSEVFKEQVEKTSHILESADAVLKSLEK